MLRGTKMQRARSQGKLESALLAIPVPWVFILMYLIGAGLERIFPLGKALNYEFLTPIGLVVFVLGAALAAWGWSIFRMRGTTTVPGRTSSTFVTWGPYQFTRNPMYVGLSIAYLGEALIQRQAIPAILLPLVIAHVNYLVIPLEESRLRGAFGDEYERYTERVRRWL
jgi:protein-S-isoprenylcysteine O-methyltransferase Ste14